MLKYFATAPKRLRNYTAAFKLQVIMKAQSIGNRPAAREFGIDERFVRRWRSEKSIIVGMPKLKKARRGGIAHWQELENNLKNWIVEHREKRLSVSTIKIRMQAKNIAADMGISHFKGNANLCFRFMRRRKLSVRQRTTVGQRFPAD